jgi:hypothetical protein
LNVACYGKVDADREQQQEQKPPIPGTIKKKARSKQPNILLAHVAQALVCGQHDRKEYEK